MDQSEQNSVDELLGSFARWQRNAIIGYVTLLIGIGVAVFMIERQSDNASDVNCALADLIAHVPAIPYDGETIDNFRGWVNARETLLNEAGIEQSCAEETLMALEAVSETDQKLLEQLERKVDE